MRVVVATHQLAALGGTETYVEVVAEQLGRMGHDVVVWAPVQGRCATLLRERGLAVAATEDELGAAPDRVLANSADVAYDLAARWPGVPQAYVCHAEVFDLQVPPQLPGVVGALVVLHDRTGRWAGALAAGHEVVRLRQPVDLARFAPRGATRERPRRVLLLGNYARGDRRALVEEAARRAGAEAVTTGSLTTSADRPEEAIALADVVVGKGRVVVEALACGRAAYVYDHNGGDGWVTPETYATLEADNFGGQATGLRIDADRLAADLAAYRPSMGRDNRDLAVRHHSAIHHAEALVALLAGLGPAPPPAPPERAALREARAARARRLGPGGGAHGRPPRGRARARGRRRAAKGSSSARGPTATAPRRSPRPRPRSTTASATSPSACAWRSSGRPRPRPSGRRAASGWPRRWPGPPTSARRPRGRSR